MSDLLLLVDGGRAWQPCARTYRGNMCGIYVDNLPYIAGGSRDPRLVVSWLMDRYAPDRQARILEAYRQRGLTDILVSWPDSRAAGATVDSFVAWVVSLYQRGFEPCLMLCSKDYDPSDVEEIKRRTYPVIQALRRQIGRWCVGWELSIWLSPTQVQQLIDWMAPQITPWGGRLYVHFQQGVASWQQDGNPFASFWNANVGKLTGILHQRKQEGPDAWPMDEYRYRLTDILDRFAGQFFCSPDSGFGHPFDCIALEITAVAAFNESLPEAEQDAWARDAMAADPVTGPFGPVRVMGAGNGAA